MLLLVAFALGCSSPSHGQRADAGAHPKTTVTDGAAPLGAMDSAVRSPKADGATSAAPLDGSVSDANLDGSTQIVPFDAAMDLTSFDLLAWTSVAWAPTSCAVKVTDNVSALQPLRWTRGTGSAAACSVLAIAGNATESAQVHPTGGYRMTFTLANLPNTNLPGGTVVVLYDMQGTPTRAIRVATYCTALYVQGESDGCWFFAYNDFQSQEQRLGCGDVKAPTQTFDWTEVLADPQVTDHVVFVHGASSSHGLRFDRSQPTQPVSVPELYSAETLGAHDTSVVAQMSYKTTGYEQPLYRLDSSASWQLLHDPKPRVVWALSTDDKNIAWVETDSAEGFDHRPGTFYLAPWPAPGAALVPRSVRVIADIGRDEPFVLHHGYFAHAASNAVDLYRTGDGAHWTVPLPDGFHRMLYTGLWLDDSYVTYTVDVNNDAGASSARSLVRCPIASVAQGAGN